LFPLPLGEVGCPAIRRGAADCGVKKKKEFNKEKLLPNNKLKGNKR
jgi:hypothetical protein